VSLDRWCYPRGLIDPPGAVEFRWGAPLRLYERGMWIAGDEYWGEPEGVVPVPLVEVIAGGARRGYEFEQLLPGGDDPDARDVIVEALALRDGGQQERAEAVLRGVAEWDPRCLDAHAHLGLLDFDAGDVEAALAHYAAGVWVAEQSLPEDFDGVLSWRWADNRPFLRCLHGLMISAWRVGDLERGETLCWAPLWLNPGDHLGASGLLAKLIAGEPLPP